MELTIAALILLALMFNLEFAYWVGIRLRRQEWLSADLFRANGRDELAEQVAFLIKPYIQLGPDGGQRTGRRRPATKPDCCSRDQCLAHGHRRRHRAAGLSMVF